MKYFLLIIAYFILFQLNYFTLLILVTTVLDMDLCDKDIDEDKFKKATRIVYTLAILFPALEMFGLYHLFMMF